jgi:LysR family transcriptional regulator, cys regulon transcriptional activator
MYTISGGYNMELQELKGFIAVARHGSFSKAAVKTFRTQPAISLQVQSLEAALGVKLFDRISPRKVVLTEDGKTLLDLASPLIDDFESLENKFKDARGLDRKTSLKIATHLSAMVYILPKAIKAFKKEHPECGFTILNRSRQEIISMLAGGEVDMGITSLKTVPANIVYKPFVKFSRVLIAAKSHPLSKKSSISIKDISEYPLLLPPKGSNTRRVVEDVFEEHGLTYDLAMEVTGRLAIKTYVEMGLGISIVNEFYVAGEAKKSLFVKDVSSYFGYAERGILTRKGGYLSPQTIEFMDLLLKK